MQLTTGAVETEGDALYYECRGHGHPLLMIPGGLGDAGIYTFVADLLADEFRVIAYDRRGQSRSTRHEPQNFELSQQGRDALAVLRAAGEQSAIVFGSSGGALVALEMARAHPHAVAAVIAHEPPVIRILPDADEWLAFVARLYLTALTESDEKAFAAFLASIVMPPTDPDPELGASPVFGEIDRRQRASGSAQFVMRHELVPFSRYMPDVAALRAGGIPFFLALGRVTSEAGAWYGRAAPILAEQLGCELVEFPGHHGSYMVNPRDWTASLRELLHRILRRTAA